MKPLAWLVRVFLALILQLAWAGAPADSASAETDLQEYFRTQAGQLSADCLSEIQTSSDWRSRRAEYRRELREMLGLDPWPERGDLKAVVSGTIEEADFRVEKLHFQASPGLYVTANFYLPRIIERPLPAILYACGHAKVVTNGVSCGNKAAYQHHGIWFARHGYACLLIDTLQLGEIQGRHRGTHNEGQWWWISRGYTPAGVEAWFGIRALDYLCSRPEVDPERLGMTGRSGGGSYTWTVAALDDRVKVAAPIAGITDLRNQVADGAVDGHCDCMFYVNTYRWDFPKAAALLAPRPLLIGNSDKDTLFPLDGVVRLHEKVRRVYQLLGAPAQLGLLITEGPHSDTQDLQVPVFRWFNRFLKQESPLIESAAKKRFDPLQLRALSEVPADEVNTTIQETFRPQAPGESRADAAGRRAALLAALRAKVFAAWPEESTPPPPRPLASRELEGCRITRYSIPSQPGVNLDLWLAREAGAEETETTILTILDSSTYTNSPAKGLWLGDPASIRWSELRQEMRSRKAALAFVAPRLVAPAPFLDSDKKLTRIRRRFYLLGQTLDSMRVWDIRRATAALRQAGARPSTRLILRAQGEMAVNVAYATLFDSSHDRLELDHLPRSHREGPDYLNVLSITDLPEVLEILHPNLSR